jgi:hypothetical protein
MHRLHYRTSTAVPALHGNNVNQAMAVNELVEKLILKQSFLGSASSECCYEDLTPKLLLAVPCPSCGVAAGDRCLLHAGGFRNELHIDRKLTAIEAVESKRNFPSEV